MASTVAQRTSLLPCLVMCPRCTTMKGFSVFGRQAGPRAQVSGIGEPVHVTDLARRTLPASVGPMPGSAWIAVYPRSPRSSVAIEGGEPRLVGVKDVDQLEQQRSPAARMCRRVAPAPASSRPVTPNRSGTGIRTPDLASTECTCALSPERNATSFAL